LFFGQIQKSSTPHPDSRSHYVHPMCSYAIEVAKVVVLLIDINQIN